MDRAQAAATPANEGTKPSPFSGQAAHRGQRGLLLLAAVASAGLYAASFPPIGAFPLAWVALVPLFLALRGTGPMRGALAGGAFAVSVCGLLAFWLPGLIDGFFSLGIAKSVALATVIAVYFALPFAALGAAIAAGSLRGRLGPGAIAAAWWACEALRLHAPLELPWALLAYSQAPWLAFAQAADSVGVLGLGALLAASNAALAEILLGWRRSDLPRAAIAGVACAVVAVLVYGHGRLDESPLHQRRVEVAVVQGGLPRAERLAPERTDQNLDHYLALAESVDDRAEIVVWPELALRFDPSRQPQRWQRLAEASRATSAEWLVGAPGTRTRALLNEPVNTALLVRKGRIIDRHEKVRLVPFSETRPPWLPIGGDRFRPGLALRPLASENAQLGVLLCSEALFPALAARVVSEGAELLVNPSNDDWFASPAATRHQVAVGVFRAIENRTPLLRPSTTGSSAVIDSHGRVLALAPYGEPAVLRARVALRPDPPSGAVLANWTSPAASGALLSSVWLLAVRRRQSK